MKDTKYDGLSRVAEVSNPYWVTSLTTPPTTQSIWTITSYDALGRVLTVTPPDSAVTTTSYSGNLTTVTDPGGKARQTQTDALGQLSQAVEAPGGLAYPTTYGYDTLGNLTSVTQGVQTRTFAYDSLSRLVTATNPESGTLQYEYDANGNLTKRTDCLGTITQYYYDGLNRVCSRTYAEGLGVSATPDVTLTYDGVGTGANSLGRLSTVANSVSSTLYSGYDPVGRVSGSTQLTDGQARAFVYTYDRAGHMVTQQYPSGRTVSSAFDSGGRASWTRGNFAIYSYQFDYDAGQLTKSFRLGNGLYEQRRYNNRLQLRQIGLGQYLSAGTDLTTGECNRLLLGYQFGAPGQNNGNVSQQTITFPGKSYTEDYTYDTLNRLFTVAESGSSNWNQTFTYDRYGNLTQTGDGVFYSSVAYDANTNRVLSYVIPGFGTLNVDHDCAGNIKQGTTYTYDAENRVTSYETTTYAYDGEGRRIKKVGGGVTSVYAYDAEGRLAAEYSTAAPSPASTLYLTADHLGSTRIVTDNYGVVSRHDYRPFGQELLASGSNPRRSASDLYGLESIRQKFTGKERDSESGLDFFGARYYWNSAGRFTSVDPYNPIVDSRNAEAFREYLAQPQNWNRYAYVWNSPLKFIDPNGEAVYLVTYTTGNLQGDEEFCKVAETRANDIRRSKGFDPKKDTVIVRGVETKSDFALAVGYANSLQDKWGKVAEVSLVSHSGSLDGPIFQWQSPFAGAQQAQFEPGEVSELTVNWDKSARAVFLGCHTADNFAQDFADAQGVPTYGYTDPASFSGRPDSLSKSYFMKSLMGLPDSGRRYLIPANAGGLVRRNPAPKDRPRR